MKREVKILLGKSVDSLVLSVEHFNRPWDTGRPEAVLILLDRAFELLLKSAIIQRGGSIRDPRIEATIGFEKCITKCLSEEKVKCVTEDQAATARLVNSLRDAAQHHFLEISEHQLYLAVRAGVTVFTELLDGIFNQKLTDRLPERIIPISTKPPTNMEVLMKVEFREIKSLLSLKSRNLLRAKGKMRTLAILEASLRGEKQHPSDAGLNRMLKNVKETKDWRTVFPGISTLQLDTADSGLAVHIRVTKNEGQAVHLVPEGTAGATTIAIRRVNELGFYNLGLRGLAKELTLTEARLLALVRHYKIQDSEEYFKEVTISKSK